MDYKMPLNYWDEHPEFSSVDWKYEISNNETRLGYWEWVEEKIAEKEDYR